MSHFLIYKQEKKDPRFLNLEIDGKIFQLVKQNKLPEMQVIKTIFQTSNSLRIKLQIIPQPDKRIFSELEKEYIKETLKKELIFYEKGKDDLIFPYFKIEFVFS